MNNLMKESNKFAWYINKNKELCVNLRVCSSGGRILLRQSTKRGNLTYGIVVAVQDDEMYVWPMDYKYVCAQVKKKGIVDIDPEFIGSLCRRTGVIYYGTVEEFNRQRYIKELNLGKGGSVND